MKQVIGELEQLRAKNIADNEAMLAKLMKDLKAHPQFSTLAKKTQKRAPRVKRQRSDDAEADESYVRRSSSRQVVLRNPITTRSRSRLNSTGSSNNSGASTPVNSPDRLVVKFGGFFGRSPHPLRELDDGTCGVYEDEDEAPRFPPEIKSPSRKRARTSPPQEAKSVDEITQEDLDMVANHVKEKRYDSYNGTTCHQCRQKTDDQKTICRSEDCSGVRGHFCGPCLRNRYGEDAKTALKDPDWQCPPCRGICNCSFCRRKAGCCSTGILIHVARLHGYEDVNAYLQSLRT
ncbi:unnamed protein product [Owenia fusiformis]|uniref:Zinc-finger domain-containing protein n=1 Tax=Owenia fusiformis TaxID=6347 RepID=A0A8S4P7G7_OWEFU|nr:unnamed protein product [Owenia fusiformis]